MIIRAFFCLAVAATLSPAADSSLLRYLPADARLVAGVDLEAARHTPFGGYVLNRIEAHADDFEELESKTGFDPRTDLLEIVIGGNSAGRAGDSIVIARARFFDVPAISVWAADKGARVSVADGVTVIRGGRDNAPAVAFPSDSVMLVGRSENIRAALERVSAGGKIDSAVSDRITEISMGNHLWGLMLGSPAEFVGKIDEETVDSAMQGDIIRSIQELSGSAVFGQTVEAHAHATTETAADAMALANVIEFFVSLAQLNADAETARLLRDAIEGGRPLVTGNSVTVKVSLSEDDLEKLFEAMPFPVHHRRHRAARTAGRAGQVATTPAGAAR